MISRDLGDGIPGGVPAQPFQVLAATGLPAPLPDWLSERDRWPKTDQARGVVLLLLKNNEPPPLDLICRLKEDAVTLLYGANGESGWRRDALAAGAFACMSDETPGEDRDGILYAAIQHRAVQDEARSLKDEAERICLELVQSFASAMEKLGLAKLETQRVLDALEGARLRILQTLI